MKLAKLRETYDEYSRTTSNVIRQLGFAGLAIIWIFKQDEVGRFLIPDKLISAGAWIVTSLGLDLLHLIIPTIIWGWYHRHKEKMRVSEEQEFFVPAWINWPALTFFWGKVVVMVYAYTLLINFLWDKVNS